MDLIIIFIVWALVALSFEYWEKIECFINHIRRNA